MCAFCPAVLIFQLTLGMPFHQDLFPERPKINTLYHLFRRAGSSSEQVVVLCPISSPTDRVFLFLLRRT